MMRRSDCNCPVEGAVEEWGGLVVLLIAERAGSEGVRSTRAFDDRPGYSVVAKKIGEVRRGGDRG
jgi:hypothetical protein